MALATAAVVLAVGCVCGAYNIWRWYTYEEKKLEKHEIKPPNTGTPARKKTKEGNHTGNQDDSDAGSQVYKQNPPSSDKIETKLLKDAKESMLVKKVRDSVSNRSCITNKNNTPSVSEFEKDTEESVEVGGEKPEQNTQKDTEDSKSKSSFFSRSCTFNIINQTKNHDIMLKQHLSLHGHYVKRGKEIDLIKPQEKGSFKYEKNKVFFGCAGVLALSMHCSCDRCTGDSEFVAAIAFRNALITWKKKSKKFAVEFMDKYLEVDKGTYRTIIEGKNSQLASFGFMKRKYKHVSLSIHMGTEDDAFCDVKVEETEH